MGQREPFRVAFRQQPPHFAGFTELTMILDATPRQNVATAESNYSLPCRRSGIESARADFRDNLPGPRVMPEAIRNASTKSRKNPGGRRVPPCQRAQRKRHGKRDLAKPSAGWLARTRRLFPRGVRPARPNPDPPNHAARNGPCRGPAAECQCGSRCRITTPRSVPCRCAPSARRPCMRRLAGRPAGSTAVR